MFQINNQVNLEIGNLRHNRRLLREKLKKRSIKFEKNNYINPDTVNIIKKYYEITDKLYNYGFVTEIKADYLKPEYWHMSINDLKPITSNKLKNILTKESQINITPTISPSPIKKINIPSEQSYYIFNLAWTDIDIPEQKKMIDSLLDYFNLIEMEESEKNNFKYGNNKEHIIKYKKKCSTELKNLIVKSIQFMIDSFGNQRVQQNTSVYVNKK